MKLLETAIHDQLRANRIGHPVFIRWTETTSDPATPSTRAIEAITQWLGTPPDRQTTLGDHTTLYAWNTGETAIVATGQTSPDATPSLDIALIGSSGAIYHTGATA